MTHFFGKPNLLGFSSEEGALEGHSGKDNYFPIRSLLQRLFGANIAIFKQKCIHVLEFKNKGTEYRS